MCTVYGKMFYGNFLGKFKGCLDQLPLTELWFYNVSEVQYKSFFSVIKYFFPRRTTVGEHGLSGVIQPRFTFPHYGQTSRKLSTARDFQDSCKRTYFLVHQRTRCSCSTYFNIFSFSFSLWRLWGISWASSDPDFTSGLWQGLPDNLSLLLAVLGEAVAWPIRGPSGCRLYRGVSRKWGLARWSQNFLQGLECCIRGWKEESHWIISS